MNITSISSSGLYRYGTQTSSAVTSSTEETQNQNQGHRKHKAAMDSESAAALFNGQMSQGMMPMQSVQDSDDEIGSFLEKVQNGTVTAEDLAAMKDKLSQLQSSAKSDTKQTTDPSGSSTLSIKSFLDKVKDGTVTDSDLSAIKEKLAAANVDGSGGMSMPPPPPPGGPPPKSSEEKDGDISSFLQKVAARTVSNSDLSSMQELLTQLQTQASDTDTSSTMASSDSNSTLSIEKSYTAVSQQLIEMMMKAYEKNMNSYTGYVSQYSQDIKV